MGNWTDQGFVANPVSYYKSAIQQIFIDAFGADFDLNDNLPQGVLIQRLAELFYGMDMDGVEAFARLNLNTMGGVFLDVVGTWRGISRVLGAPQTGVATVSCGTNNFSPFTLQEGTVLTCVESGDTFTVSRISTIDTETSNISIAYTESGNSSAIVGNTMSIEGFPQIQNIEIISLIDGTDRESDISYRSRLQKEYPAAGGTVEFVANKLRALPAMKDVNFLYNDSDTQQGGIPAYCTEWIVAPKTTVTGTAIDVFKESVAKIIIDNKTPGAPTYGNTHVNVPDIFGSTKTVNFTMATEVPIQIEVTVSTPETTGVLDLGGIDEIKAAVVEYINNLGIGKYVSYSRCILPFAANSGFDVISYKIKAVGGADWYTNTNFYIGPKQYASITSSNIEVGA